MGAGTRDSMRKVYISDGHSDATSGGDSPGPIYTMRSSIEPQDSSTKRSQPAWVFGKDTRFQDPSVRMRGRLPAPNAYVLPPALGEQVDKPSAPVVGFGTSTREHVSKIFLSAEHEKANYGTQGPGPKYMPQPVFGPQPVRKEPPSFSFGTCDRFYTRKMALRVATPAPGAYNV